MGPVIIHRQIKLPLGAHFLLANLKTYNAIRFVQLNHLDSWAGRQEAPLVDQLNHRLRLNRSVWSAFLRTSSAVLVVSLVNQSGWSVSLGKPLKIGKYVNGFEPLCPRIRNLI